ncbi:MAG: hypothetical protein FJ143_11240 [Deltaproteobacteria bacterium]|nr:hypothetical protein [Deltaproteobacteria bacterium]
MRTVHRYPETPGSKIGGASAEAADALIGRAKKARAAILAALIERPMTADEYARTTGESPLFIRPRFSELKAAGRIEPSGQRARNDSGMSATVWRIRHPNQRSDAVSSIVPAQLSLFATSEQTNGS